MADQEPLAKPRITFAPGDVLALDVLVDTNGNPVKVKAANGKTYSVSLRRNNWTGSNGEKVIAVYGDLRSQSFAADYLQKTLKGTEIVRRGANMDRAGHAVGEKIVAVLKCSESNQADSTCAQKSRAVIIRTRGTEYWQWTSDSLENVLAFDQFIEDKISG